MRGLVGVKYLDGAKVALADHCEGARLWVQLDHVAILPGTLAHPDHELVPGTNQVGRIGNTQQLQGTFSQL
jgi:hypothetical protein